MSSYAYSRFHNLNALAAEICFFLWRSKDDYDDPVVRRGYFKTNMNVYYGDKKIDAVVLF